jgi:phage tail-like protein
MPANSNSTPRNDPFGAYWFEVEFDTEHVAYPFRSCSGLKSESTVVELEEGGFNTTTRKLVGRTKFPNIVLKRGFCTAASELYKLRLRVLNDLPGKDSNKPGWVTPNRFSGVITQKGPNGTEAKWRFSQGWVCKWEGPELDASKNEISIESIEIAHEGLVMLESKPKQKDKG